MRELAARACARSGLDIWNIEYWSWILGIVETKLFVECWFVTFENQFFFECWYWYFGNQTILGIVLSEFRKPIYLWVFGLGTLETKLCLKCWSWNFWKPNYLFCNVGIGLFENHNIVGFVVLFVCTSSYCWDCGIARLDTNLFGVVGFPFLLEPIYFWGFGY